MKKGFALITVLAILIIIALGTAMVLKSVGSHTSMKSNNLQDVEAQYVAEAAMQYALWVCRQNNGDCSTLNGMTWTMASSGLNHDVKFTTNPTSAGAASYTIIPEVDYSDA